LAFPHTLVEAPQNYKQRAIIWFMTILPPEETMAAQTNRQFRLKQRPVGRAKPTDIGFVEAPIPTARVDEAIVQTLYLSTDPTNREQYMPLVPSRSGRPTTTATSP
jgi:hypothetical protein